MPSHAKVCQALTLLTFHHCTGREPGNMAKMMPYAREAACT